MTGSRDPIRAVLTDRRACADAVAWSEAHDSFDECWSRCDRIEWMLWSIKTFGGVPEDALRRFAGACVRRVAGLLGDPRAEAAVLLAEQGAVGDRLRDAFAAATAAMDSHTADPGWSAAAAAARASAVECARRDVHAAASGAALHAARAVAWGPGQAAGRRAEEDWQTRHLRAVVGAAVTRQIELLRAAGWPLRRFAPPRPSGPRAAGL